MKTYLKIKIMSLAAEAKIIRHEEKKWDKGTEVRWGLYYHRINDVRSEARAANLAYGYLRGRSYAALESKCYTEPNWNRVLTLVNKYGTDKSVKMEHLKTWAEAGVLGRLAA